jgi:hypothetical protein
MRRYTNINESPNIAAYVTPSMLLAQQNNEQLKMFLDEYGYKLEEMCLPRSNITARIRYKNDRKRRSLR